MITNKNITFNKFDSNVLKFNFLYREILFEVKLQKIDIL